MRNFRERFGTRLRRKEIETAVNLECIPANDFRVETARDIGGKIGLTGGSWANDVKDISHRLEAVVAAVPSRNQGLRVRTRASTPKNKIGRLALRTRRLPIETTVLY